jgi:hypothetical protein
MKVAYSIRDDSGAAVITCLRVAGGAKVLFHQVHRDFLAYVWAGILRAPVNFSGLDLRAPAAGN